MRAGFTRALVYAARNTPDKSSSGRVSLKPPFLPYRKHVNKVDGMELMNGCTLVIAVRTAARITTSLSCFARTWVFALAMLSRCEESKGEQQTLTS